MIFSLLKKTIADLKAKVSTQDTKIRALESSKKRGQAYINTLRSQSEALSTAVMREVRATRAVDRELQHRTARVTELNQQLVAAKARAGAKGDIMIQDCVNPEIHVHRGETVGVFVPAQGHSATRKRGSRTYYGAVTPTQIQGWH